VEAQTSSLVCRKSIQFVGWYSALFLLPMGLALAAGPGRVEKSLNYQTNLSPHITIFNLEGRVLVRAWDKAEVRAVYATSSPRVTFETDPAPASGSTDRLRLVTHAQDPMLTGQDIAADYTLDVPADSSLEIRNRQGLVKIDKLTGDVWVESVGGNVVVADTAGHLAVRTIGGNIEVVRSAGRVEVSSVTGDLHFSFPTSSRLHANTTSGKIVFEGDFAPGGEYVFSEYSGSMEIICPADSLFKDNVRTVRGKLFKDPEFAVMAKKSQAYSQGNNSLLGPHGAASVELTSFSGNITIRHQQ